jgi:hypothetical protein
MQKIIQDSRTKKLYLYEILNVPGSVNTANVLVGELMPCSIMVQDSERPGIAVSMRFKVV